jgi:hypothetical protein
MAGGYAEVIDDIVDIHARTIELARETFGFASAPPASERAAERMLD